MTLDCVGLTQISVILIIHLNVDDVFVIIISFFLTFIFHRVVKRRICDVVGYIIIALLQIVCKVRQRKNFKNRLIIGENIDKSNVARFHGPQCRILNKMPN